VTSLRLRLFVTLVTATGLVWFAAIAWTYVESRAQFESILDRRLMEAARMVDSLFTPARSSAGAGAALSHAVRYDRHLSCQIWSLDGRLIGASDGSPDPSLSDQREGFSNRVLDGQAWRVYALSDPAKGVRILVGDNLGQRRQLEHGLVGSLLVTAACVLPILAPLIWFSLGRGLRPLNRATRDLAARDADNLERVEVGRTPSEIRPLVDALNRLFGKVAAARDHERSFLAYAAHELRTPLAGLKTQVQVAMRAPDAAMRDAALAQTLSAVDRSARLVQQLLTLSRLDSSVHPVAASWIPVEERLRDLLAGMGGMPAPERVAFAPGLATLEIRMDEDLFDLAMRNLMENALLMTPADGTVAWAAERGPDGSAVLSITDSGPGIAAAERALVVRRFVRGSRRAETGSGLGLAIVTMALEQSGARLQLDGRGEGPGLKASAVFGAGLARRAAPATARL
jgi:two-component system, OmpR family, sensor histidine kinase QseC